MRVHSEQFVGKFLSNRTLNEKKEKIFQIVVHPVTYSIAVCCISEILFRIYECFIFQIFEFWVFYLWKIKFSLHLNFVAMVRLQNKLFFLNQVSRWFIILNSDFIQYKYKNVYLKTTISIVVSHRYIECMICIKQVHILPCRMEVPHSKFSHNAYVV